MKLKNCKRYTYNTFAFFAIAFLMIGLIPISLRSNGEPILIVQNILSTVFFACLLLGIASIWIDKREMNWIRRKLKARGKMIDQTKSGFATFSKRKSHLLLYALCTTGALLCIIDLIAHFMPSAVALPVFSATLILFAFHCLVDGKNYKTLKLAIRCLEE